MTNLTVELLAEEAEVALPPQCLPGVGAATAEMGPIWIVEEVAGHLRSQSKKRDVPRLRLYQLSGDVLAAKHELDLDAEIKRADVVMSLLTHVCEHRVPHLNRQPIPSGHLTVPTWVVQGLALQYRQQYRRFGRVLLRRFETR